VLLYFILQSFNAARIILVDFSLYVSPKIKIAKTEIWGPGRSQSSADYSVA
jgi:hypothetical protein